MVIRNHESATSGERALWQEVLLKTITDARLEPDSWPIPKSAYQETAEARAYLITPSKDLATVCSLAGVEVEALLDRMQKQVAAVPVVNFKPKPMGRPPKAETAPKLPKQITPKAARTRGRLIDHAGRCLTVKGWSALTGISAGAIRNRLRSGWTVADALTVAPDKSHQFRGAQRANTITHNGETLTYRQWAERTGLSWFTIRERVDKGWPVEEVLRPGDLRGKCVRVEVDS